MRVMSCFFMVAGVQVFMGFFVMCGCFFVMVSCLFVMIMCCHNN
jgi:hypothetical protein